MNDVPRRICLWLLTPAERAIWDAMQAVEAAGGHPLLTDAVNLLSQAQEKVADYVDHHTKRSIDGTHHQVSEKHLPLYLAELDYKYNTRKETDGARATAAIPKIAGKRLMLRRPSGRG